MGICAFRGQEEDPMPELEPLDTTSIRNNRALIIFVVGGPGVGKTTLCTELASKYDLFLISLWNSLREEVASGSQRGQYFKKFIQQGLNIPAEVIVHLVAQKMLTEPNAFGYLVVGFPRERKQAVMFNEQIRRPDLVISLYGRRSVLQERMSIRAAFGSRFDDTPGAIFNRVTVYYTNLAGAIAPNKSVTEVIDAEINPDEVFREASQIIDEVIDRVSKNETE